MTSSDAASPTVVTVEQARGEHFPGFWPAVDLGLATCATLLLADNVNPAGRAQERRPLPACSMDEIARLAN